MHVLVCVSATDTAKESDAKACTEETISSILLVFDSEVYAASDCKLWQVLLGCGEGDNSKVLVADVPTDESVEVITGTRLPESALDVPSASELKHYAAEGAGRYHMLRQEQLLL